MNDFKRITVEIEGKQQEIEVPSDATPDEIDEIVNAEAGAAEPEPAAEPGMKERIAGIAEQEVAGEITRPEGILQSMGEVARPVNEAVGKVVGAGVNAFNWAKSKIPVPVKEVIKKTPPGQVYELAKKIIPPTMEAAGKGYGAVKEAHPRAAADIEALAQIAGVAGLGLGVTQIGKAALPKIGEGLQATSQHSRPKAWGLRGSPEQVKAKLDVAAKNDIWAKAAKAAPQTDKIIGEKYTVLKKAIEAKGAEAGATINPVDYLDNAAEKALKNASPTNKASVKSAFEQIRESAVEKFGETPIDLADAQLYKQQLGEWADDAFDVTKRGKAVSAQSGEHQAYITAYDEFKTGIESLGPPGVKEANQELSKLLELRRDMRKRATVQQRNNFIPLDEVVSLAEGLGGALAGHPLALGLYGLQVGSKSGAVGRGMYKLGGVLKGKAKVINKEMKAKDLAEAIGEKGEKLSTQEMQGYLKNKGKVLRRWSLDDKK